MKTDSHFCTSCAIVQHLKFSRDDSPLSADGTLG